MKKIVLILVLAIGMVANMFGQELNVAAKSLKTTEFYPDIKKFSVEKWGNNHEMVVYEINNQSDAVIKMIKILNDKKNLDREVFLKALGKWADLKKHTVNFEMVVYEYKEQMKAKTEY
jgi:hypothetical protein